MFDGSGTWSLVSDLAMNGAFRLQQGTFISNGNGVTARDLNTDGRGRAEFLAGNSVVQLQQEPDRNALREVVRPANSTLVVQGNVRPWDLGAQQSTAEDRDINVCGTNPGQTPFTVNAQLTTNYNGFGVRCRGNCNATVTVSVTGGSGNFTYQWLNGGPPTATWTTACGGPQLVIVTDVGQGISCPAQVNVTEPAPVGVIFFGQGTPPTCAGVCDGTRTALGIGGVSPHTYSWNNGAGTNSSFSALCAGSNSLRITDRNGCTFDTTFIFNLAPIAPNLSFSNAGCFGECNGTASVAPTGGTGQITAFWTPPPASGQGTFNASGLCAGNYSVRLSDVNGCDTTVTFMIAQPPPIVPNLTTTNATCSDVCNGSAVAVPTGAAGPYTFLWSPAPGGGQGSANATGLCAANYTVLITDQASGCDTLLSFIINAPPAIQVQGVVNDASCSNTCDGDIALSVSGGTAPYSFVWTPVPPVGQGTGTVGGLCPGDWSVVVTDQAGCDTSVVFTVGAPPPLDPVLTTTDVSCAGLCDGSASVVVTGGVAPYSFLWTPVPTSGQGTPDVSGLCAGDHTVLITDANGCDTTLTFLILEPPPLTSMDSHTDVTCGALCDGTASVVVAGGMPGYNYAWTPEPATGQGTADAGGFCAGPVSVLITDMNGCTLTRNFVILDAVPITISLQLTPATCPSACDGTARVIVGGGVAPYSYLWAPLPDSGQGTPNATGLCAQAYSLTVTDAVGCDTTISFTIDAPEPIIPNGTTTDVTCAGDCDGSITVAPTGGNGVFSYNWSPQPTSGQGTATAAGLCAGDWAVTITSGACDTTVTFTILEPPPITASVSTTDASCNDVCDGTAEVTASGGTAPLTYQWAPEPGGGQGTPNASGLCPGGYTITVSDAAGCDTVLTVTIMAPPPIVPSLVTTPETCDGPCTGTATVSSIGGTGPVTANWQPEPGGGQGTNTATGLCSGTNYTVTLSDINGCDTTLTFMVLPSSVIEPNSSTTQTTCAGACDGTATVGPTGGTGPYTYVWSPQPATGQGTPSATGFCAGPVQVTITDATLCSVVANILVVEPPLITDNATVTQPLCAGVCDGSVVLSTTGGVPPYTYLWSPVPPNGQGQSSATSLCPGVWNVTITGSAGCVESFSYTIVEPPALTLTVTTTPSQCQVCIGSATATGGGGTGPLTYEWTGPGGVPAGNTPTITDLCAGTYTVVLRDANGCTLQRIVSITDSDGEELTTTDGTTTCPNTCDGEVSVAFTCSDPPCLISWTDADGNDLGESGTTVSDLCPGDYYVSVINASGCLTIDTATVTVPITVVLNISSTPASCGGECDASATVGVVGGTPPFTFTWVPEPGAGQGTPNVSGLCEGVYEVSVGDGGGCITVAEVLILEPDPLSEQTADVQDISCAGECDGSISMTVEGGTGPYTYLWTPTPAFGQGTSSVSNLCAGPISLRVTDANGCILDRAYTITEPQPMQIGVDVTQPSSCALCDGTGSVTVNGGTAPYTFSWAIFGVVLSTDQQPTNLCSGLFTLTVTDAAGCVISQTVTIPNITAEELTMTNGQTLCSNACDGEVSVSYNCSAPPCTVEWADADGNLIAVDTDVLGGLCNGTYTVVVLNADGCKAIADAVVLPSQTLVPNLSTTAVGCPGVCDGTATVGPVGGVEPYTFTWSPEPGGGQGSPMATGLCAGVYEVLIADASGCDTTVSALILEPTPLVQQALVTDVSCNGSCDGSIVVTPTGGLAPYTFVWSPVPSNGQGSNGAFDLCAGDHVLTVTDANGCSVSNTWTVGEPSPLQLVGGNVDSECGVCDGEAFVTVTGGTAPYNYLWTLGGAIFGTNDSLSALCPGLYSVLVTDAAGCEAALVIPVQDITGEVLTTNGSITSCPGICDGTASVDFICGSPDCTIAWFDATGTGIGQSGTQVSALCAGLYFVEVTNGIGCVSIATAVITEPDPVVPNLSTTPETCFGACDGTATVGPTGGIEPYEYFWDPAPPVGQFTPQAEGLCAGTVELTITDAAGCELLVPVLILGPPILTADIATTPITCNGDCDANIQVSPSGGVGPYTFFWTPEPPNGQGNDSALELCPGDWSVQVIDANGCDTTYTITVVDPQLLQAELNTSDNLCFGECIGTVSAAITGGVEPYSVTWSDADGVIVALDTVAIDSLCAGAYTLSVVDANGCERIVPFTITEGSPIDGALVFTGETCFGPCDGTASVSPSGGVGPYDFVWQPEPGTGQGTDQVTGLCAGNWSVTITDQLGCDTVIVFTLLPYTPISDNAKVNDVVCNGACDGNVITTASGGVGTLTYFWTPEPSNGQGGSSATGLCPGDFTLLITDAAGCDSLFAYTIVEPLLLEVSVDMLTPASCADAADGAIGTTAFGGVPPYTFSWTGPNGFVAGSEDLSALMPGAYDLTLTDANGCVVNTQVVVDALVTVVADAGPDQQVCLGTEVILDGTASAGAVEYAWSDDQGGVISTEATTTFVLPAPGLYTFTLTVTDGPCSSTDEVIINYLALPIADAGPDRTIFLSETATLGGDPSGPLGSTFTWTPDTLLSDGSASNPIADPATTTWYVLTVVGPNGCVDSDSVLVTVVPTVVIPTGFTPNSDGKNDTWVIDFIELFPDCTVEVYNRWGEQLFRSVGYKQPWDGKVRGGFVPVGTYYYAIELNDERFPEPYTGPLTIIR
ncbi:MAG: gliding motility-associated C-terminal domain-containing protein [Flavobacteriales bacterium]